MADSSVTSYMQSVAASSASSSDTSSSTKKAGTGMDMSDFLTLMVAQLKNQDVYNTMDNTEFVGQMAQYTMIQTLTELYEMSQATYSMGMVGKNVTIEKSDGTQVTGTVESAHIGGAEDKVKVNDSYYSIDDVIQINTTPVTTTDEESE